MKKILALTLVVVMICALFAGTASAEDKKLKFGVAMATTRSTFYAKMANIIQDYCKEIGVDCTIADPDYDLEKQIAAVENFIASGCNAIMVVAFDPQGINDICQEAVDRGILVVVYDGEIECAQTSLVVKQYDYGFSTGTMAADWILSNETLKNQERIECGIFDYPTIPAIIDRANGIKEAIAERCPNVVFVDQQSAALTEDGVTLGENFLQAHPNMQMICAINDNALLGAYQVWNAAGHVGDDIGFFGADADTEALQLIAEGTSYRGTVSLTAETSFPEMIDACVEYVNGKEIPEEIFFGMAMVTPENVADYLE